MSKIKTIMEEYEPFKAIVEKRTGKELNEKEELSLWWAWVRVKILKLEPLSGKPYVRQR